MMTVVYDVLKTLPPDTTPCIAAEGIDVFVASRHSGKHLKLSVAASVC